MNICRLVAMTLGCAVVSACGADGGVVQPSEAESTATISTTIPNAAATQVVPPATESDFLSPVVVPSEEEDVQEVVSALKTRLRSAHLVPTLEAAYRVVSEADAEHDGQFQGAVPLLADRDGTYVCLDVLESSEVRCGAERIVGLSNSAEKTFNELSANSVGDTRFAGFTTVRGSVKSGDMLIESIESINEDAPTSIISSSSPSQGSTSEQNVTLLAEGLQLVLSNEPYGPFAATVELDPKGSGLVVSFALADVGVSQRLADLLGVNVTVQSLLSYE